MTNNTEVTPEVLSTQEFKISPTVKVIVEEALKDVGITIRYGFHPLISDGELEELGAIQKINSGNNKARYLMLDLQEYKIEDEETGIGSWVSAFKREVEYPDGYGIGFLKNCLADISLEYKRNRTNKM